MMHCVSHAATSCASVTVSTEYFGTKVLVLWSVFKFPPQLSPCEKKDPSLNEPGTTLSEQLEHVADDCFGFSCLAQFCARVNDHEMSTAVCLP